MKTKFVNVRFIDQIDALYYEVASSPFAHLFSNPFLQKIISSYYSAKVKRKYQRYLYNVKLNSDSRKSGND